MQACLQELIFRNLAHGLCDVAEAVRIADQVELFHIREKDRVADTVREIVHTAELVSHRMDISEGCVIECDTCEILTVSHLIAGLHVNTVCNCLREILGDHRDRHQRCRIGQRVCIPFCFALTSCYHGHMSLLRGFSDFLFAILFYK